METKIWKFGGAFFTQENFSNFRKIFKKEKAEGNRILFVVSAIAEMTRLLRFIFEKKLALIKVSVKRDPISSALYEFRKIHEEFILKLFAEDVEIANKVKISFERIFSSLLECLYTDKEIGSKDIFYAQILKFGELSSAMIFNSYLCYIGIDSKLFDARDYVLTDGDHKESKILKINPSFQDLFSESQFLVTQGFIGKDTDGNDAVLGFDGSDLSAVFFAREIKGNEVSLTFWKDVKGFYSQDPKINHNAEMCHKMRFSKYEKLLSHPIRIDAVKYALEKGINVNMQSFLFPKHIKSTISL
jgi:aspartate kinase